MGQQQVLVSSKGVAFDMAAPPPPQASVVFAGGITGNNTARMRTPRECHRCFKAPQEVQHLPTPSNPFRVPAPPPPPRAESPNSPTRKPNSTCSPFTGKWGSHSETRHRGARGEGQAVAPCTWQMCPSPYEHTSPFRPINGLTAHCNWRQGRLHQDPGKHTCLPSVSSPKIAYHPILLRTHSTKGCAQSPGENGVDPQRQDLCPHSECWKNSGSYPHQSSSSTSYRWKPLHASQHPKPPRDPTARHNTSSSSAGHASTGRGPACSSSRLAQLSSECVAGIQRASRGKGSPPLGGSSFSMKNGEKSGCSTPSRPSWNNGGDTSSPSSTQTPPPKAPSCQVAGMHCEASRKNACSTAPLGTSHGIHGHAWQQLPSGSWEEHWPIWQTGEGGRTSNRPGTMPRHLQTGPCLSSSPYPTLRASKATLHATWAGSPSGQKMSGPGKPGKSEQGQGNPHQSQLQKPSSTKRIEARPVETEARSPTSPTPQQRAPPLQGTPQMRAWSRKRIPQPPPPNP